MIIDFFTRKESVIIANIMFGYKKDDPNIIWCDKYISYRYKMNCSCEYYEFMLGGD